MAVVVASCQKSSYLLWKGSVTICSCMSRIGWPLGTMLGGHWRWLPGCVGAPYSYRAATLSSFLSSVVHRPVFWFPCRTAQPLLMFCCMLHISQVSSYNSWNNDDFVTCHHQQLSFYYTRSICSDENSLSLSLSIFFDILFEFLILKLQSSSGTHLEE